MKKQLLLLMAGMLSGLVSGQTILINENFDSYASGNLVAETIGLPWSTWSVVPGGTEDTPISDEQASSGTLSAKVSGAAAGGPTDLILRLGDRTTGIYALSWNMYIPAGNGGYFNIQRNEVPGTGSYMLEVTFNVDGTIEFLNNGVASAGSYTHDAWFNVGLYFDLDAMNAVMSIDDTPQYTWQTNVPGPNQVGGIDFFAYAGGAPDVPTYYFDDVLFVDLSTTNVPEVVSTEIAAYPNPAHDVVTIDVPSVSAAASVSLVDATGQTVMEGRSFEQHNSYARAKLDLSGLSDGLYFVRIQDVGTEIIRRVTKH